MNRSRAAVRLATMLALLLAAPAGATTGSGPIDPDKALAAAEQALGRTIGAAQISWG